MARHAPILIAGTIAATVLSATSATKAYAQDRTIVLNEQALFGDVFAGQGLNVVDARQQITVSNTALGNQINGGTEGQAIHLDNAQTSHGEVSAETRLNVGREASGRITALTQARGNEASAAANNAALSLDSRQTSYGNAIATSVLENPEAHFTGGLSVSTAAYGNNILAGGNNTQLIGSVEQGASGATIAETYAPGRYVPGQAYYSSDAASNMAQLNSTGASNQNLEVRQMAEGWTSAETVATAANAWNSVATSSASANRISAYNAGGSQVLTTDQSNTGGLSSRASTYAYDYGDLRAMADGTGNQVSAGNHDVWVEIDNTQFNSGGVSVSAELTAHNGYDAYVGANATGNSVSGYACSDCAGILNANSTQVNHGNVAATATTTITGQGRAVITGTTATGNSANFYVTRPGG